MDKERREALERDGFILLRHVFDAETVRSTLQDLTARLERHRDDDGSIRASRERVYASRNLLRVWPEATALATHPTMSVALGEVLGADFGLVRGLFFDKPPGRSWSLPWHKDMTIAVRDNLRPSSHFSKPTTKAGVPHVEAPEDLLRQMITARIHLRPGDRRKRSAARRTWLASYQELAIG